MNIKIDDRHIGTSEPAFIIAEIGQAHDGSLGAAHAYIDAVAKAGVDAVKFQTHIASAESTVADKFRVKIFPQDETRFDYWKRMEFTASQWAGLKQHADDKNLIFLSTPFSSEAVQLLEKIDMSAWKIASGEITNLPLLDKIARTKKPVLLSSGMSTWSEIDDALTVVQKHDNQIAIFQCTTAYPCPAEMLGLNVLDEIKKRYGCAAGLSDHSGTIYPSIAAAALGVNLIEVHAVFSRDCFGPDTSSSVTIEELTDLVRGVRFIESALRAPVDKREVSPELKELSLLFGKSLYAKHDLAEGQLLQEDDVSLKKPGTGIPAKRLTEFIGQRVQRDYCKDEQLQEADFYEH